MTSIEKNIYGLIFLFVTANVIFATPRTKVLIPKNSNSVTEINISGKFLKYYEISTDRGTILNVRGPGKLKLITRGKLSSDSRDAITYHLSYRINGGKKIKVDFNNVKADNKSFFKNELVGIPTIGENIIAELARGENTIEIWNESGNSKIFIRSLFTEIKEKKIDWVKMSPSYPNDPVSLVTNEDVVSYFRFSSSKPLTVKITGPTVLRILNRVEFDYKMKGKINYRIEVKEDKKLINTYMLCSDRSDVTRYKKDGKKTPGKANEMVINVPSGTHKYELIPLDNYTVLARILFPKKDIKLEEK